jgi:hypothetical protein
VTNYKSGERGIGNYRFGRLEKRSAAENNTPMASFQLNPFWYLNLSLGT